MKNRTETDLNLFVDVSAHSDLERDEIDQMTRDLRLELLEIDVTSAELVHGGSAPDGTKTAEVITLGTVAVAVLPSVLPKLVEFLQAWTTRSESRKVKIKSGSIEVEIPPSLPAEELKRYIDALVTGHTSPSGSDKPDKSEPEDPVLPR